MLMLFIDRLVNITNNMSDFVNNDGNNDVMDKLLKKYGSFMFLKVYVDDDCFDVKKAYVEHIFMHNAKVFCEEEPFFDSGFDLFFPDEGGHVCDGLLVANKIDFKVKCSASILYKDGSEYVTGYMLFPRSSLSKTPLRLANSVGVIDSGYRGNIIGMFDCKCHEFKINYMDRLLQICSPTMCPIYVELVEKESDLGVKSSRGEGGFGSTGR
jgi:dUTP pyrophosphatase